MSTHNIQDGDEASHARHFPRPPDPSARADSATRTWVVVLDEASPQRCQSQAN